MNKSDPIKPGRTRNNFGTPQIGRPIKGDRLSHGGYRPIVDIESLQAWEVALKEVEEYGICGLDLRTTGPDPLTSRIRLANIAFPDGRVYVADVFDLGETVIADLAELVEDEKVEKVMHDAKQNLSFIRVAVLRRLKFKNIGTKMLLF